MIADVNKNHLGKNLTDYQSKDFYNLSVIYVKSVKSELYIFEINILAGSFLSITYHFFINSSTLAFFHCLGKHSFSKQILKRIDSYFIMEEEHVFIMQIDNSLCSLALLGYNDVIIFTTLSEQISKVDNLSLVLEITCRDRNFVAYCRTLLTQVIIK